MTIYGELRRWFSSCPERLVIFTLGLLFGKGIMTYVLETLMTYFTDFWKLGLREAAAIVNLQEGLRNMLQILVAISIDACLGYRPMLIVSSILYSAGLGCLAFSVPQYIFKKGKVCPAGQVRCFNILKHTPIFWFGLALVIAGGAAQVIPLYSLSFEQTKIIRKQEHRVRQATRLQVACCLIRVRIRSGWHCQQIVIRWLCRIFLILGVIASTNGFLFFKNNWHQRFWISALVIAIGLIWFLYGSPFYGPPVLQPSPPSTMLRVLIAASRKRHLNYQENLQQLHRRHGEEDQLTDYLRWLNTAAVKESPAEADDDLTMEETRWGLFTFWTSKRWRLCTVKEVEQTKLLLNIIPMAATFIVYGMVQSLGNTFFIEQANQIPNGIPIIFFQLSRLISAKLIKIVFGMVFERRIKERMKRRYSDGVKIGLGMLACITCCAVASAVEAKRLKSLKKGLSNGKRGNVIVKLKLSSGLLLQFFLLGAMDGLAGDGIKEFFGHYAPDSRRYGGVFTSTLSGFGTLLSVGFIAILDYYSKFKYKASWVGESINQSRLDIIYRAYNVLALLNCFLYAYVSTWYSYDNIIGEPEEEDMKIEFLE